jgi:hypothetical protein
MYTYVCSCGELISVSVEEVMGEFSRMTHHLYCIGLRDDLPSLKYLIIACWLVNCA